MGAIVNFLLYLSLSLGMLVAFTLLYTRVTPYDEVAEVVCSGDVVAELEAALAAAET